MRPRTMMLMMAGFATVACASSSGDSAPEPRPSARSSSVPTGTVQTSTSTAATLGVPPGHLPPPGECRIWRPGTPPGHQQKSGACSTLERQVPPGAWLIYRPSKDKKVVNVWVYDSDDSLPNFLRIFDAATGVLLSEESL